MSVIAVHSNYGYALPGLTAPTCRQEFRSYKHKRSFRNIDVAGMKHDDLCKVLVETHVIELLKF
jgi:hypothetical protein